VTPKTIEPLKARYIGLYRGSLVHFIETAGKKKASIKENENKKGKEKERCEKNCNQYQCDPFGTEIAT